MSVEKFEVAVVGGDLAGIATAYHLARRGIGTLLLVPPREPVHRKIDLLILHYPDYTLSKIATRVYKELKNKKHVEKRGALWLFQEEDLLRIYEKLNKRIWGPLGITARLVPLGEVEELYPQINTRWYIFAAYTKEELVVDLDSLRRELLREARRRSLLVLFRDIEKITTSRDRVESIVVRGVGRISIENLVLAGQSVQTIPRELVNTPQLLLEIGETTTELEPYKYTIKPLLIDYSEENFYVWQTRQGVIKTLYRTLGKTTKTSLRILTRTSRLLSKILHGGVYLRITRTETNKIVASKTKYPLVGTNNQLPEGLYINTGYGEIGEPIAYYTSKLLAEQITRNKTPREIQKLQPPETKSG